MKKLKLREVDEIISREAVTEDTGRLIVNHKEQSKVPCLACSKTCD